MRSVRIEPCFESWRARARVLLAEGVPPEEVLWEDGRQTMESLFEAPLKEAGGARPSRSLRIPRAFISLAELVACHSSSERWGLLYRIAWRVVCGGEAHLLEVGSDRDLRRLERWAAEIRRDRHKMKAFVRFRKVGERASQGGVREQFVAWFEPEHHIVERTAPFFARRFAGMDWSILTPERCAHWDGESLRYTEGVDRRSAPSEDALEAYWRSYYKSIFNPARLKTKAMLAEMPQKYWVNLPEAPLIADLTLRAGERMGGMIEAPQSRKAHVSDRMPRGAPVRLPEPDQTVRPLEVFQRAEETSLAEMQDQAAHCRACPLYERATQVIWGEGPANADIMIVGEQPGDREDLEGRPFVGPAGKLLEWALAEAGIRREAVYLTNAVKHFKWKRAGKHRLHQSPSSDEVHRCRPWVLGEIAKVKPKVVILLGATAAKSLIRPDFAVLRERGEVAGCPLAHRVIATVHPASLLRMPTGEPRDRALARWVEDVSLAVEKRPRA